MKRCIAIACCFGLAVAASVGLASDASPAVAARGLVICVAQGAPPEVRQAAEAILAAVSTHSLMRVMAGAHPPTALTASEELLRGPVDVRAFNHLVLIGLPDDPAIAAAWQREARVEPGGLYVFGFGHLRGDIGYVESDRNPFLHGCAIARAPYETEVVTITGASAIGVVTAVRAFLDAGLVNGVVAAPGWTRGATTLLDRDPLCGALTTPSWAPTTLGKLVRIGVTQPGEDEYRGVLSDAGVAPQKLWRVTYHQLGDWDGAGAANAIADYMAGLHRRASGRTLWEAQFASVEEAERAAPLIAKAAGLSPVARGWSGEQPSNGPGGSPGSIRLWRHGRELFMTTLPAPAVAELFMSGLVAPEGVNPAPALPALAEDFEGGRSVLTGVVVETVAEPGLPEGGTMRGRLPVGAASIPSLAVPTGAKRVAIEFDRLFLKSPEGQCGSHYTRLMLRFEDGVQRAGANDGRAYLDPRGPGGTPGRWAHIVWHLDIPAGAKAIQNGTLFNRIEQPMEGYDNPVFIDNFAIRFE